MNISLFLAKRYFFFKKSSHIVNIISWISVISIVVCTAAFIVILSVFNGIDDLIKSLYNSYSSDLKISPVYGKQISLTTKDIEYLKNKKIFSNTTFIVTIDALIQIRNSQFIIKLESLDSSFNKIKYIKQGVFFSDKTPEYSIILSQSIASSLGIDVDTNPIDINIYNTPINVYSNNLESELISSTFFPIGEYKIHKDIDMKYCFAPLFVVKKISGLKENEFTSINLNCIDNNNIFKIKQELENYFKDKQLKIEDKFEQNGSLFKVINSEKISIIIILAFIIFISSFNISGTINLLIIEKLKQINLLKSFGMPINQIKKIFIYCGIYLGFIGVIIGLILGYIISALQYFFHLVPINGDFIINYFPVKIKLIDFFITILIVFIITFLATFFSIIRLNKELKNRYINY